MPPFQEQSNREKDTTKPTPDGKAIVPAPDFLLDGTPTTRCLNFKTHDQIQQEARTRTLLPPTEIVDLAATASSLAGQPDQGTTTKRNLLKEAGSFVKSIPAAEETIDAVVTRAAYLGLTDQLHIDQFTMRKALARVDSPVARQLVTYVDDMQATDWKFSRMPKNSPLGMQGTYDMLRREVKYRPEGSLLTYIAGATVSPIERTAGSVFAHEIGHHKSPFMVFPNSETLETLAKRHLVAEAKAMLTEIHIAEKLRIPSITYEAQKNALKGGVLGSFILEHYPEATKGLHGQGRLANTIVNEYLEHTFGSNLIDPKTNTVRPFDLKAGLNQPLFATMQEDAYHRSVLADPKGYLKQRGALSPGSPATSILSAETRAGSMIRRGGKALGTTALFLSATDVVGGFAESKGAGFGKLTKVGTEWAAFEAGTAGGSLLFAKMLQKTPPLRAATIFGIGIVSAYAAGKTIAPEFENFVRSGIDNRTKDPKRPYTLRDYVGH